MGIPMYREPSTEATKNNDLKDPTAAARSAIRRQATTRRPPRFTVPRGASFLPPFPSEIAGDIARESDGFRNYFRPIPTPGSGEDPLGLATGVMDSSRREAGQRLSNDALRHGRPGQRMRIPRNTTLYDQYRRPSPGDGSGSRQDLEQPPFTPRFAPAIAYHSTTSPPPQTRPSLSSVTPHGFGVAETTVPLLRRIGHRSVHEANRSNRESVVDGLGDRQRSVGPDDDHANDAWETLLTTITPDANLPSADSSFTSASASGTNASRNGTSRSSTTSFGTLPSSLDSSAATVQMVLDPYLEFINPCDYPSSTDSESESDTELDHQSLLRRYRRRRREVIRRAYSNTQSTMSSHPPIPTISFAFSDSSADPDLQQMQGILHRFVRREAVPDDWWATTGLTRAVGPRPSANNESDITDSTDGPVRQR